MLKNLILTLLVLIGMTMPCLGQVDAIRAGLEKVAAQTGQPSDLFHEVASLGVDTMNALPGADLKSLRSLLAKCLE